VNPAIVKIDVAADLLGKPVRVIEQMVSGGNRDLFIHPLVWVFDLASSAEGRAQRPRFWRTELMAHASNEPQRYCGWELEWVLNQILPAKRVNFQAGELDMLFQLRPITRTRLHADMLACAQAIKVPWSPSDAVNFYPRSILVSFLTRRWLGAIYDRLKQLPPRAAATNTTADTNKQTTHAAHPLP
jgi:hypothetical protein